MKTFPQLIFGYHGCELDVAERIVLGRDALKASENSWDWLGTGAYFWEGAPDRARDWANRHCKSPAVLGAVIDLGRCMNLMDVAEQRMLQRTFTELHNRIDLPINKRHCHDLDCLVVLAA